MQLLGPDSESLHFLWLLLFVNCSLCSPRQFYSNCHNDSEGWSYKDVPRNVKEWLRSARVADDMEVVNFPKLRSLFRGNRLDFVSSDPSANSLSWKRMGKSIHHGFLYGHIDDSHNITGDGVAFVYNNMEVAFYGQFQSDVMVEAKEAKVTACRCYGGMMELQFTLTSNPTTYSYEQLKEFHPTKSALDMDPLDKANVVVDTSTLKPINEFNQGLFAKRDLTKDDVIVLYGGVLQPTSTDQTDLCNKTIQLNDDYYKNIIQLNNTHRIDVPPEYDQLHQYRATLGHKGNHNFDANADYERVFTPRFGLIRSLIALRDIKKGEEIFCDYDYDLDHDWTPDWYKRLYFKKEGITLEDKEELAFVYGEGWVTRVI